MEHTLTTLGQKVDSLETRVTSIEQKLDKLIESFYEFTSYIKGRIEHHEQMFDTISATVLRLENSQTRVEGMLQYLYFRDLQD